MKYNNKIRQALKNNKKSNLVIRNIKKVILVYAMIIIVLAPTMQNISYAKKDKNTDDIESEFLSSIDMVLDILKKDKDMSSYENTYKYIYYKYTDDKSYKTELDFSSYNTSEFSDVSTISGSTIEEKVWFTLTEAGISEYATAGVMGNIYGESGFNPSDEYGGAIGLCQWLNGRKDNLIKYAKKKGKSWKDEDCQIEFLLTETTGKGAAKGYATKSFMTTTTYGKTYKESDWKNAKDVETATKAFCATFERPAVNEFNSSIDKRVNAAKDYYEKYHGKTAANSGSSISVANGTADEKLNYLFDNNIPTTKSKRQQYMKNVKVAMTDKNGKKYYGTVEIHKKLEKDVQDVFKAAQDAGFKIYEAGGYQDRTMNNGGSGKLSHHAYGVAIDINVNENYSHRGSTIYAGKFWNPDKSEYSIPKNGVLVKAFEAKGWKWGGNWSGNYQDYMHFSFTGN